jgi:hypothetical protein
LSCREEAPEQGDDEALDKTNLRASVRFLKRIFENRKEG